MKKVLLGFVAVFAVVLLTACGSSNKLIGTWEGKTEDGLETTFTFEKKDKVSYSNQYGIKSEGTYSIKDDVVTIKLDTWDKALEYTFTVKNKKLTLKPTSKNSYSPSYDEMTKK